MRTHELLQLVYDRVEKTSCSLTSAIQATIRDQNNRYRITNHLSKMVQIHHKTVAFTTWQSNSTVEQRLQVVKWAIEATKNSHFRRGPELAVKHTRRIENETTRLTQSATEKEDPNPNQT